MGAESDATLLALEVSDFTSLLKHYLEPTLLCIKYGRHFISNLNFLSAQNQLSDVIDFKLSLEELNLWVDDKGDEEHLLFLSHFKQEAGTEATLMEEAIGKMIRDDENHPANYMKNPCFLDSSD